MIIIIAIIMSLLAEKGAAMRDGATPLFIASQESHVNDNKHKHIINSSNIEIHITINSISLVIVIMVMIITVVILIIITVTKEGHSELVDLLIAARADVDAPTLEVGKGQMGSALMGSPQIVAFLTEGLFGY